MLTRMRVVQVMVSALVWSVLHPSVVSAQVADLKAAVERVRSGAAAPGALVGIRLPNGDAWIETAGLSDLANRLPMTPQTPFYVGSVTKTWTAAVVMQLVQDGRLALTDTIGRFFPGFPDGGRITVEHLLNHTSGLKDFYSYLYFRPVRAEMIEYVTKRWTEAELITLSGRFGRWFEPGADWSYSSTGYYLLGVIAERVTGLPLTEAYRRYVYTRLGLRHTWLPALESGHGPVSTGYLGYVPAWKHSEMFGELGPTTTLDQAPNERSAGGIASTAADALTFMHGLVSGRLVSPESYARMTRFRETPPLGGVVADTTAKDGYGLGLIRMERLGHTMIGHGGLFNGHTAALWYLPACDVTIVLYVNRGFIEVRNALDVVVAFVRDEVAGCRVARQPGKRWEEPRRDLSAFTPPSAPRSG